MINKVIAAFFLVMGGTCVLLGILSVGRSIPNSATNTTTVGLTKLDSLTKEQMEDLTLNHPDSFLKMREHELAIQDINEHSLREAKTDKNISSVVMLVGLPIVLVGVLLYRRANKYVPLPATLKIMPLIKKQNEVFIGGLVIFVLLFILIPFLGTVSSSPLLLLFLFICAMGVFYCIRELVFFNDNFGNAARHLVNWEYPNGDVVVITRWGLMKHNQQVPELKVSIKLEEVKWEFDNVKDLAESLVKNEGNPLVALLPSIEFATTSNRVEDYITFSFWDTIELNFVEKDKGYLLVNIEKKFSDAKYRLRYPLPTTKESLASAFAVSEKRIARWAPVRAFYISESMIEEVKRENLDSRFPDQREPETY